LLKQNKSLVVGFCLSALLVSCSHSAHEEVLENNSLDEGFFKSGSKTHIEKNKQATRESLGRNKEQSTLLGKRTLSFNGEKYLFDGEKLRKGSQVRNIYMSEKGMVKGTFVIVAKAGEIPDISFKRMTKIAKDTFRIIPIYTDDLMLIYNEFLLNESIVRVELEIVYGGKSSNTAVF